MVSRSLKPTQLGSQGLEGSGLVQGSAEKEHFGMMMRMRQLQQWSREFFAVQLTKRQGLVLERFGQLLLKWNACVNLTAITDMEEIVRKHFLDSLAVSLVWKGRKAPRGVIDIGSGAGFPGLVLAIAYPDMEVTLVEATGKKVRFLETAVKELGVRNARVLHGRAEALGRDNDQFQKYDIAVARAVAPLVKLVPLLSPFVRPGGLMVAMKGERACEEIRQLSGSGNVQPSMTCYLLPGEVIKRALVLITV